MTSSSKSSYDFIIVGAGPSGCTLATILASSAARPSVLLLEAGTTDGTDPLSRIAGQRFFYFLGEHAEPSVLPYETVPQEHLNGQKVPYTRGSGLGGSTAINFAMWTIPPRAWHEEMVSRTGDEEWAWEKARERYRRVEGWDGRSGKSRDTGEYLSPRREKHGRSGLIKVGFPEVFEESLWPELEAWKDVKGFPINQDSNSGDMMGLSVVWNNIQSGRRSTAADMLQDPPSNLSILTGARVARVILGEKVAVGVATVDGRVFYASKEVVLAAGSLDTPKLLMLSGIGPADQLTEFGIRVVCDDGNIGRNLQDHYHAPFVLARNPASLKSKRLDLYRSKEAQTEALEQWKEDQTGPLAEIGGVMGLVLQNLDSINASTEMQDLTETESTFLCRDDVPSFEIMLNGPNFGHLFAPDKMPPSQAYVIMLTTPQSRGTVTLQSADPNIPLAFDPGLFAHQYDRRVALEATKYLIDVLESLEYAKDTTRKLQWPTSSSEEDILEYWRQKARSTWHMCGTVRMGSRAENSCVDADFRVWGVDRLRVADISVLPLIPPSHPQTVAYMIGLMVGDRTVQEYGLNQ